MELSVQKRAVFRHISIKARQQDCNDSTCLFNTGINSDLDYFPHIITLKYLVNLSKIKTIESKVTDTLHNFSINNYSFL